MRKPAKKIVEVKEDNAIVKVEIEKPYIDFYKKETGHSHVSQKGLSNFIQRLVDSHRF